MFSEELVTKKDLEETKKAIINYLQEVFSQVKPANKKWLKSQEVMKLLNISSSGLQNFRINNIIPYTKIGGIIYYSASDIDKILEKNKTHI